jgi:hypothetical protein
VHLDGAPASPCEAATPAGSTHEDFCLALLARPTLMIGSEDLRWGKRRGEARMRR